MGFLTNLFKSKELVYVEQLYKDTKASKEEYKTENKELRLTITDLNKQILHLSIKCNITRNNVNNNNNVNDNIVTVNQEPKKLSPKEQFIYDLYLKYKTYDDTLKHSGLKESSFKVYLSRIRKKQKKILF